MHRPAESEQSGGLPKTNNNINKKMAKANELTTERNEFFVVVFLYL
jgi:hypothetical protein